MKTHHFVIALCLTLLIGCQSVQTATSPVVSPVISALPTPQVEDTLPLGPEFTLDPVRAGDTTVAGTGPAGVPIRIVDLSQVGAEIGSGVIDRSGHFSIPVTSPIVGGARIGIQIGDLSGTEFQYEDFLSGPGYSDLPMIGVVFTSTLAANY